MDSNIQDTSITLCRKAVGVIKAAILKSQARAAQSVNQEQLALYYGIGRFVLQNSRNGFWGTGAIVAISQQLTCEMPGLKGFSANIRNMRTFYEEWNLLESNLAVEAAKIEKTNSVVGITDLCKDDNSNLVVTTAKLQSADIEENEMKEGLQGDRYIDSL